MTDNSPRRLCTCCGALYTDKSGHDEVGCVKSCEKRAAWAEVNYNDAMRRLGQANDRLIEHNAELDAKEASDAKV